MTTPCPIIERLPLMVELFNISTVDKLKKTLVAFRRRERGKKSIAKQRKS